MKHLKPYNHYNESIDIDFDIYRDLKDICLDLTDNGYSVRFESKQKYTNVKNITEPWFIIITKPHIDDNHIRYNKAIPIDETIKDTILRVIDYIKSHNYRCDINLHTSNIHYDPLTSDQFEKLCENEPGNSITLQRLSRYRNKAFLSKISIIFIKK